MNIIDKFKHFLVEYIEKTHFVLFLDVIGEPASELG